MEKLEAVAESLWLVLALLYPLPSPTDGDGSVNVLPHKAELRAGIEMMLHV